MVIPGLDFPIPMGHNGGPIWPEPDPSSPFWIEGPALISFSGGRTSAFMLFQIMWAHGGVLPADVHVTFANTGKEREETLRFVHECAVRWGVRIRWLEWKARAGVPAEERFEEAGFNSASRNGEPFKRLIASKKGVGQDAPDPRWIAGDSNAVLAADGDDDDVGTGFDFIFSCPPYGDLEVYSDDPADISTLDMAGFDAIYAQIIAKAVARLADNRFACFVVGDYRNKRGIYANFVSKTIAAFEAAGAPLYNEAILVTSVGSLPIRTAKQFRSTRKLGKTHQNVLVFVKGDPRLAVEALGPVDVTRAIELTSQAEGGGGYGAFEVASE